jgi:hypothetical protein
MISIQFVVFIWFEQIQNKNKIVHFCKEWHLLKWYILYGYNKMNYHFIGWI